MSKFHPVFAALCCKGCLPNVTAYFYQAYCLTFPLHTQFFLAADQLLLLTVPGATLQSKPS